MKFAYLLTGLAVVAAPATAQSTIEPRPVQSATAATDVNKIVCKKQQEIGSRLGAKKVCLTVKQWQDRADIDREDTARIQQNTGTRPSGL